MRGKVVGIQSMAGTGKKSGKAFDSYVLHMVRADQIKDVEGQAVKEQFIDKSYLADQVAQLGDYKKLVGKTVDVFYNERGFVDTVRVKPFPISAAYP